MDRKLGREGDYFSAICLLLLKMMVAMATVANPVFLFFLILP